MSTNNKQASNDAGSSTRKPSVKSKDETTVKVEPTKKNAPKVKSDKTEETSVVFTSRRVWPD